MSGYLKIGTFLLTAILSGGLGMLSAAPPFQRGAIRARNQQNAGQRALPTETIRIAGLDVAVWKPSRAANTKAPLILFSHGFRGCNTQSTSLMAAFASAGYLVMAPNHKDASCGGGLRSLRSARPDEPFRDAASWSDNTYRDRRDDFNKLDAGLRRDSKWATQIDWSRVGLVGHSLGGYTVLGLAGGWPGWKLPGIKAVLALSPYCEPYVVSGNLAGIGIPVMYQGGTRDVGITPSVKRSGGCFEKTSSPAVFVEFEGVGHFSWSDLQGTAHGLIEEYSVTFLDKYVRGVSGENPIAEKAGVRELRGK